MPALLFTFKFNMPSIKEKLFLLCMDYADERIRTAQQGIVSAKEASVNDTKSSAGDKYETTREMMQQEISFNEVQLFEAQKLKHALTLINPSRQSAIAEPGSLVLTDNGQFFIAVSAGSFSLDGKQYFVISPASPVAKVLIGLKKGDKANFNGKVFTLTAVE